MIRHAATPRLEAGIRIDGIPTNGRDIKVDATAEQREQLATDLGITAVDRLEARLHATPFRGGMRVTGDLKATIEQPCVVTLAPVKQDIDEPIDRVFLPQGEKLFTGDADADIFVDPEGDDLPDHFEGGEADLSDLIIETLALAIDPYPRAPGATLDPDLAISDVEESPFAALKALKKDDDA